MKYAVKRIEHPWVAANNKTEARATWMGLDKDGDIGWAEDKMYAIRTDFTTASLFRLILQLDRRSLGCPSPKSFYYVEKVNGG